MSGNVWEWCEDVYDELAYARHGRGEPPREGEDRVFRGGGYGDRERNWGTFDRRHTSPGVRYPHLGFRAAASGD